MEGWFYCAMGTKRAVLAGESARRKRLPYQETAVLRPSFAPRSQT